MFARTTTPIAATLALSLTAAAWGGTIFSQDFNDAGAAVGDYIGTPGTSSLFDGIGTTGGTVSVSIDNGALQFNVGPDDATAQGYGGFLWTGDTGGSLDFMSLNMAMTVDTGGFSNANTEIQIVLGQFTGANVLNWSVQSNGADAAKAYALMQNTTYVMRNGSDNTSVDNNTTANIGFYANRSGASAAYMGDDGLMHTLDNNSKSLFVNGVLVGDNIAVDKTSSLQGLRVTVNTRTNQNVDDGVFRFDDIVISDTLPTDIPEPATLALLGAGALVAMRRRR